MIMVTVGEILKTNRDKKKLTIEQVEKTTKIRAKFIKALEDNRFDLLPGPTFARGFVKNYAAFLDLPIDEVLAFYRRQANGEQAPTLPPPPVNRKSLLTPQHFTAISVGGLLLAFFIYLIFSYLQFAGSPVLLVNSPTNNAVVLQDNVEIIGKTDPGATLTINDQTVGISENGSFDVKTPLQPGLNTLRIVSTNKFGKKTTVNRTLRLERQ